MSLNFCKSCSQRAKNGVSEFRKSKIFWGEHAPYPLECSRLRRSNNFLTNVQKILDPPLISSFAIRQNGAIVPKVYNRLLLKFNIVLEIIVLKCHMLSSFWVYHYRYHLWSLTSMLPLLLALSIFPPHDVLHRFLFDRFSSWDSSWQDALSPNCFYINKLWTNKEFQGWEH